MPNENQEFNIIYASKIYDLLEAVRQKPNIWLSTKSITALQDFLNGYLLLSIGADLYNPGDPDLNDFKYWILYKGKANNGVGNSFSKVLLKECAGDEEKAFASFFTYLDEFKKEKNVC